MNAQTNISRQAANAPSPIEALHSQWINARKALDRIQNEQLRANKGNGKPSPVMDTVSRQTEELIDSLSRSILLTVPITETDAAIVALHGAIAADVIAACATTSHSEREALSASLSILAAFLFERLSSVGRPPFEHGDWIDCCQTHLRSIRGDVAEREMAAA